MYCSNCGYKLSDKVINNILKDDNKRVNDIKYLSSTLINILKFEVEEALIDIKENDKENYKVKKVELNRKLKEDIAFVKEKEKANDLEYFKNELKVKEGRTLDSKDIFVCPRCGKLVRHNLDEEDIKSLARASHSEIHRGRNNISSGMCGLMIGVILTIIGFMFFALSFKATNNGQLDTSCVEFYVFVVLLLLGIGIIVYAIVSIVIGRGKIKRYEDLLRNINNDSFHQ